MMEVEWLFFKSPRKRFMIWNGMFSKSSMYTVLPIAIFETYAEKDSEGVMKALGSTGGWRAV